MIQTLFIALLLVLMITSCGKESPSAEEQSCYRTNNAVEKIAQYAKTDGRSEAPLLDDYKAAGINGVTNENIVPINAYIAGLDEELVDTSLEIQFYISDMVEVTVSDTTPPVISLLGSASVTIEQGAIYTDAGASAIDGSRDISGDINKTITVVDTNIVVDRVNTSVVGTRYLIIYAVEDSAGNRALDVNRTVTIVAVAPAATEPPPTGTPNPNDTEKPVITLNGPLTQTFEYGGQYRLPRYKAMDDIDGEITRLVQVTGGSSVTFSAGNVGVFKLKYNVKDRAGNAADELVLTITVKDSVPPVFTSADDVDVFENEMDVITVTANDLTQSITYSLVEGTDIFAIDAQGKVTFKTAPDYETSPTKYSFTVEAKDKHGQTRTQVVSVYIKNIAEQVPHIDNMVATVDENAPAGTTVTTITRDSDADRIAPTGFVMERNPDDMFAISSSGVITLAKDFNSTGTIAYDFNVHATTSSNGDSNTASIDVN
jgi:hypothetical protein